MPATLKPLLDSFAEGDGAIFDIADTKRGRGGDVDREPAWKLTKEHLTAVKMFIDSCNSKLAPARWLPRFIPPTHPPAHPRELLDIPCYVAHAEGKMNKRITKDRVHEEDGNSGSITALVGTENLSDINGTCLNMTDTF
jgi:hypothetical protein